jgi:hypothetical protein
MQHGGMSNHRNGLTAEMRERLERIVIELLAIAARREDDPALQHELMKVADKISAIIDADRISAMIDQ